MNCIDCRYNLIKDGHYNCTYEEGECIKISVLEKENAELKEDLRNKKLAIQNRNGRIKELEEKISVLLSCKNCPDNKGGLVCQKEYEDKCLTQKIQYIKELQEEIAELEAQIEKMKCCENCAWWYKLPNGQRDCAETCENRDNWSLRR